MKMTKIESARIIVGQKGRCPVTLKCKTCFTKNGVCGSVENRLALAEAYIKRHESKSKKKDHILDTTKKVDTYHKKLKKDYVELKPVKVTRPNFRKYLRDKIDMKVRVTPELSEELQKICFEEGVTWVSGRSEVLYTGEPFLFIVYHDHDAKYSVGHHNEEAFFIEQVIRPEATEYNPKTDTLVEKVEEPKQVGIDNSDVTLALTAQYEPVKDCPANSEIPQPVKLPDFVYSASKNGVGFIDTKNRTFNTNDKGELLINDKPCFATPEEALQVAKKLWNGEKK